MVKGARQARPAHISNVAECKDELRESDPFVKAQAIRKLTYLQMMGYDMSWASFKVEVMSQPRFAHKHRLPGGRQSFSATLRWCF